MIKRLLFLAGIILAAGLMYGLVISLLDATTHNVSGERVFDGSEVVSLDIRTHIETKRINTSLDSVSIEINPTDHDEILVTYEGENLRDTQVTLTTEIEGDTLHVDLEMEQMRWLRFWRSGHINLNIYLPKQQYEEIVINSEIGEIIAEGITVNELQVATDIGDIKLSNIISEQTTVTNDIGMTDLYKITGNLEVKSDIGEVNLIGQTLNHDIDIQTEIGEITIEVEQIPENATFILSTELGSASLFGESTRHKVMGDGENIVNLSSEIGEISIRLR